MTTQQRQQQKKYRQPRQQQQHNVTTRSLTVPTTTFTTSSDNFTDCAICFFGLPRSFELLVLPSIKENIFQGTTTTTTIVMCTFIIISIQEEQTSRTGNGGKINVDKIEVLLQNTIEEVYNKDDNNEQNSFIDCS